MGTLRGHERTGIGSGAARPVGLFFDLGDTLVDLRGLGPAMAGELGQRFRLDETVLAAIVAEWVAGTADATAKAQDRFVPGLEIAGAALRSALAARAIDLPPAAAVELVRSAWARYLPVAKFHDDVTPDLLRDLRGRVKRMGVVTDSDTSMVEPLLDRLGIRDLFDVVVVSDSVGAYKPNPRIFLAALKGGRPQDALFVSNSLTDLEGAAAVGMGSVWVRRGQDPAGCPPGTHVIGDLRGLPDLLDRLAESRTPSSRR